MCLRSLRMKCCELEEIMIVNTIYGQSGKDKLIVMVMNEQPIGLGI